MSLFSTLGTGYSGLSASEVATATTGHNIANANTEGYTRQRVVTRASVPFHSIPGDIGQGVKINQIVRIHDEYVFSRLKNSSNRLSHDDYMEQTLNEIAKQFPDLQDLGIAQDLTNYFNSWNDLAANSNSGSQKISLIQSALTLSANISDTRKTLRNLQDSVNVQLKTNIDEINSMGQQIVDINKEIAKVESIKGNHANDLRDERDQLELTISKMLNISTFKSQLTTQNSIDANATDQGKDYHINIAGGSFIDGITFHPLVIDNSDNANSYYLIYTQSQDGTKYDITNHINGGKIGALLDIRGRTIDKNSSGGFPQDGKLQGYIDDLDTLANSLIVQTNNIYAKSASKEMISPVHKDLKFNANLKNSDLNLKTGNFDLVMYDDNGVEVGRKTIAIDNSTIMGHIVSPPQTTTINSIVGKINSSTDDNGDNNSINDIDDYFKADYSETQGFTIQPNSNNPTLANKGYSISFEDNGTNFPGAIGINQFFTGNNAKDITIKSTYMENPSKMQGYKAPVSGNNDVANDMVQLQYDKGDFYRKNGTINTDTLNGFYSFITTTIATDGESAGKEKETSQALFNTVQSEFASISGVSTDEELANLIKFQTAYGANAKVITTVDRMLNTLLGIKQ